MTSPSHLSRRAIAATVAVALATLTAAAASPAWAGAPNDRCAGAVERHLQSLGVAPGAVERTDLITEYANLEMGTTREIQAWTSLKACSGAQVTRLSTSCRVKDTYTRGDCQVAGVARH